MPDLTDEEAELCIRLMERALSSRSERLAWLLGFLAGTTIRDSADEESMAVLHEFAGPLRHPLLTRPRRPRRRPASA